MFLKGNIGKDGEDGIIENSQEAAEDTEISASKEYILESWAYVLAKCENFPAIAYTKGETGTPNKFESILNEENFGEFSKAMNVFKNYISNYGKGEVKKQICCIQVDENTKVITKSAYIISFSLKDSKSFKNFYIVDDTKVYDEEEFIKYLNVKDSSKIVTCNIVKEIVESE